MSNWFKIQNMWCVPQHTKWCVT